MDGIENDRTGEQINNMSFFDEVSVVTVNAGAEYGRMTAYNMLGKRGASQFHGQVYYKHFNSAMNSRRFFDARKTPFIQHEYQGELSGPIRKDKTFFYASWFAQKIPLGFAKQASVPTVLMRGGNFSQFARVLDPFSADVAAQRAPFPNNAIPARLISPISQKTQDLYIPEPNGTGFSNNFGWVHPYHYDFPKIDSPAIRLDHNLSQNNQIYFRWTRRLTPYVLDRGLPKFLWTRLRDHRQWVISDTHLFSATLVNTFRFGWNNNYIEDGLETDGVKPLQGQDVVAAIGLQGVNLSNYKAQGFPIMSISGLTTLSTVAGGVKNKDKDLSFEESLTWSQGRHVWKFGGEYKTYAVFDGAIPDGTYGNFNFNGTHTTQAYADFLLGIPFSSTRLDPFTNRTRTNKGVGMFITDTFKATAKLTLDYGVRWDYLASPTYTDGFMFNWEPQSGNVTIPQGARSKIHPLYPRNIPIVDGRVVPTTDKKNFRPRVAAAYRMTSNTVLRGGYGTFTEAIDFFTRVQGGGPFQINETYTGNQIVNGRPSFAFPNPYPTSLASASIPSQSVTGYPLQTNHGTYHQYNFSIEREVKNIGLRASYIGTRGTGLNYNLQINKPRASLIPFTQSRRPNPLFVGTTVVREDGRSHYDSLQLQGQKRVGSFTFNAHWTWSNNLSNFFMTEDPYEVTSKWSRLPENRRHYAVFTTGWQMPFGRGKRFLATAPAVVNGMLGGWTFQSVSYFASGIFFSPSFSGSDPSNTNTSGGLPDRIADGNLSGDTRTKERWFDAGAFRAPRPGSFGNSAASVLRGQGLNVHHISLTKRFPLTERVAMVFTGAVSNLFNHPHFNNPRSDISVADPGRFTSLIDDFNPEKQDIRHVMMKLRLEW